jgi:hypothetical protein
MAWVKSGCGTVVGPVLVAVVVGVGVGVGGVVVVVSLGLVLDEGAVGFESAGQGLIASHCGMDRTRWVRFAVGCRRIALEKRQYTIGKKMFRLLMYVCYQAGVDGPLNVNRREEEATRRTIRGEWDLGKLLEQSVGLKAASCEGHTFFFFSEEDRLYSV